MGNLGCWLRLAKIYVGTDRGQQVACEFAEGPFASLMGYLLGPLCLIAALLPFRSLIYLASRFMFRKKQSRRTNAGSKFSFAGRSLRFETMEGRLVLSASGFAGNECAPELNDAALDAIVPTEAFSSQAEIAFQFSAANVVSDAGVGATEVSDIRFTLDPDIGFRDTGATPVGATISLNDQGTTDVADDTWDFSWTPTATQVGRFRLFLIATDAGGTDNLVPLSDVYAFQITIDNRPSVDLNGSDQGGINADAVSFTEADDSTPVSIVDSDLFILSSNDQVASATIEIVDPQADGLETLGITAGGTLLVDSSTPGKLVLTVDGGGLADKSVFEDALRTLTYHNTSDAPEAKRTINVTVSDGTTSSSVATATVNIQATNDAPDLRTVPGAPDAKVGEEYLLNLVATDPDGSGELLVFRITSGPGGAVISPNGLADNSSDNTIQVSPDTNGLYRAQIRWTPTTEQGAGGSALFTVVVTDTGGLADPELYEIGIENQAPTANDDPSPASDPLAVGEDAGDTVLGDILANDTDADGDTFSVHSVSAGGSTFDVGVAFTHPTSGATILVAANGQVNYNPNGTFESLGVGETATDTFQYTIIDENSNESGQATVTVTINGANDPPTATDVVPVFRISEDAGATVLDLATLLTAVADGDSNDTLSVASAPGNPVAGGIFALNGDLTFDPNGDFEVDNGAEVEVDFMVTIEDSAGEPVTVAAKLIIGGVNEPPAVQGFSASFDEDSLFEVTDRATGLLANATDDKGNAGLVIAEVNGEAANVGTSISVMDSSGRTAQLTVNSNGTLTFDPRGGFDSLPAGGFATVNFTYRATDGETENSLSNLGTAVITVLGLNDAPVASNVTAAAIEDGPTIDGNFDGDDPDDGETSTLNYTINSQPSEGTAFNNNDGTFAFDPEDEFQDLAEGITRDVTFNYTATDTQTAVSDAAIATITVTGVNDAPVIDISNATGIPSVLPTGSLGTGSNSGVVVVELDLSSADPNINRLNMVDIPAFTSDLDGDSLIYSLASGDNGGTPFPNANNRPTLNASSQLEWTPTTADIGTGYVIRVQAGDNPTNGNPLSTSVDIQVSVVAENAPQVASASDIVVSLDVSEVTLLFNKAMGSSAFDVANYSLATVDGVAPAGTSVSILTATQTGDNGVILQMRDPTITSLSLGGTTMLKLTLDPQIADLDGNTIVGSLERDINLITVLS